MLFVPLWTPTIPMHHTTSHTLGLLGHRPHSTCELHSYRIVASNHPHAFNGIQFFSNIAMLLLSQVMVLNEGLHMSDTHHLETMPTKVEILADASSAPNVFE